MRSVQNPLAAEEQENTLSLDTETRKRGSVRSRKADLHVHSRFSTRPSEWILQKIGCAESYTDPVALYHTARRQGMDFVTITDHNTIEGALQIAHLPHTFISEEVTAYFPEDRCKLHVLCYNITEAQHEEIQGLRTNVYELVDYFLQQGIPHAMAHAMYSLNGKLTQQHIERLILLFRTFELNGARNEVLNSTLCEILGSLDKARVERMADEHNMLPRMHEPWRKYLIGGSDDHSSLNIARTHTVVQDVAHGHTEGERIADFLRGISDGRSEVCGEAAQPETMAHNLYSIAYQFYKNKFALNRHVNRDLLLRFADRALTSSPEPEGGLLTRLHSLIGFRRAKHVFARPPRSVQGLLQKEAEDIIWNDDELRTLINTMENSGLASEQAWFRFVNHASETVMRNLADSLMGHALGANLFSVFNTIGSAGSLYAMLAPYFVAYTLFTKDRTFCAESRDHFIERSHERQRLHIGHFSDTYHDVNGVARTLQMQLDIAHRVGKRLKVITCGPSSVTDNRPGVVNFDPIGTFTMPEYPELALYYPPVLRMLQYAYDQNFTHIHSATPGPIGLVALAVSRILQIPIHGTYHTAFPQYVSMLTDDAALEEAMWRYMIWYYNQMDRVYVPSRATGEELVARGLPREKVVFYQRGIDTEQFHPRYRNGFFKRYVPEEGVKDAGERQGELKFVYVGRISLEKNIHVLTEAFRLMAHRLRGIRLVVVGDGPYREEMELDLKGLPVTFTGYLTGEDLAAAYASSDVFVFPSGTDTFGNVVLEAQASGLPVIVSDMGGPKENLIPGKTGFIVPEGDPIALADAMLQFADAPEMLDEMRKAARAYTESRSFEACFMHQWEMYREKQVA
ncbi:glycosyltransferase [Desulfovibrio mangrovi]|uniref:glycosyltransferase n=1 Tax=Desulfovibrio mangrovi TaxID=2976983 RepID=UPI0022482955|nr:glycosyltransferase [Desulfovibrio mangrovi]UZP66471.1 glycosyltransferase [Desulfovibrio mangrovi]